MYDEINILCNGNIYKEILIIVYNMNKIINLITRKGFYLMAYIDGKTNIRQLAINSKMTYSHCHALINKLEIQGVCVKVKTGRSFTAKLTEKGVKVQEACRTIKNVLEKQ